MAEAYQPRQGDICLQGERRGRWPRFKVYVYRKHGWEQFGDEQSCTFLVHEVQSLTVPPWHLVDESEKRRYYRNAAGDEEHIPQFPHDSGWVQDRIIPLYPAASALDPKDYIYAPYFYEHITLEEAERRKRAAAVQVYKIETLFHYPLGHMHRDTYFVTGAFLGALLQHPIFTAEFPHILVSIEPVERMPSTDEKLNQ